MHVTSPLSVAAIAALAVFVAAPAASASEAYATEDVNMRSGPGTEFPVVGVILGGRPVTVVGCLPDGGWCDAVHDGDRAWVSGRFLARAGQENRPRQESRVRVGPQTSVPVITFWYGAPPPGQFRGRPAHRQW